MQEGCDRYDCLRADLDVLSDVAAGGLTTLTFELLSSVSVLRNSLLWLWGDSSPDDEELVQQVRQMALRQVDKLSTIAETVRAAAARKMS
jgi:hypothetical protein